jgi:hypothetical protein
MADHDGHDARARTHSLDEGQLVLDGVLVREGLAVEFDPRTGGTVSGVNQKASQRSLERPLGPYRHVGRPIPRVRVADDDDDVVGTAGLLHGAKRVARYGPGVEVPGVRNNHGHQTPRDGLDVRLPDIGIDRCLQPAWIGRVPPTSSLVLVNIVRVRLGCRSSRWRWRGRDGGYPCQPRCG